MIIHNLGYFSLLVHGRCVDCLALNLQNYLERALNCSLPLLSRLSVHSDRSNLRVYDEVVGSDTLAHCSPFLTSD